eukprot:6456153-Amphidinium_carterae.1
MVRKLLQRAHELFIHLLTESALSFAVAYAIVGWFYSLPYSLSIALLSYSDWLQCSEQLMYCGPDEMHEVLSSVYQWLYLVLAYYFVQDEVSLPPMHA